MNSKPCLGSVAVAVAALASSCTMTSNRTVGSISTPARSVAAPVGTTAAPVGTQGETPAEPPGAIATLTASAPKPHDIEALGPKRGWTDTWVSGPYDAVGVATTAVVVAALVPMIATDDEELIQDTGDLLQIALPTTGGLFSIFAQDWQGLGQFAWSLGSATATTHAIKGIVDKSRPDATANNSFPSGHTQAAFSGASFINRRYGPRFGVPAYLLAGFTGASRMVSSKHFGDDVLAGASLAVFMNAAFVEPLKVGNASISPMLAPDMLGVTVDLMGATSPTRAKPVQEPEKPKRFRYELQFGPGTMVENEVDLPRNGGSLKVTDFQNDNDPVVTAMGTLEWYFEERHELDFRWWPYEVRDSGNFSGPVTFAGQSFAQGEAADSNFIMYDYRFRYRYRALPEPWDVRIGAGAAIQDMSETIVSGPTIAEAQNTESFGFLHARVGYELADQWLLAAESDFGFDASSHSVDASAFVRYEPNRSWDFSVGYRWFDQGVSDNEVKHDLRLSLLLLGVGYSI